MDRDFTFRYIVDVSQADPGFAQVRQHLSEIGMASYKCNFNLDRTGDLIDRIGQHAATASPGLASLNGQIQAAGATHLPRMAVGIQDVHVHSQNLVATMANLSGAFQLLQQGVNVGAAIGAEFKAIRDYAKEAAKDTQELRNMLRELAALQGKEAPTDKVVAETVMARLRTGMTRDEVGAFETMYEGSAPAGREKGNIKPEVEAGLREYGARFGIRKGMDAGTAGDLTGVLAQYGPIADVKAGAGMLESISYGLNEGRGNVTPLAKSLLKTAGTMVEEGGKVDNLGDLSAILGVASLSASPDAAGTKVLQASRELRRFSDPKRGTALMGLGITPDDDFLTALGKIAPHAAGENGDVWLQAQGFNNREGNQGLIQLSQNYDLIMKRKKEADARRTNPDAAMEEDEKFQGSRLYQGRMASAVNDAAKFEKGVKNEGLEIAREMVEPDVAKAQGGLGNRLTNWVSDLGPDGGLRGKIGFQTRRQEMVDKAVLERLRRQAKAAGIGDEVSRTIAEQWPGHLPDSMIEEAPGLRGAQGLRPLLSSGNRADVFNKLERMIQEAGGKGDVLTDNAAAIAHLKRLVEIEEAKLKAIEGAAKKPAAPKADAPDGKGVKPIK